VTVIEPPRGAQSTAADRPQRAQTPLRGFVFLAMFYTVTVAMLIAYLPTLALPRRFSASGLRLHSRLVTWLFRVTMGVPLQIEGRHLLPDTPCLIACQHQSAWDTIALIHMLGDPAIVLKAELLSLPLYGWFTRKFEMIPIERGTGTQALRTMKARAQGAVNAGRHVLIFPEGTRQPPERPFHARAGVAHLYEALDLPCVPVALNSGWFWPPKGLPSGSTSAQPTLRVRFLAPIPPGMARDDFRLQLNAQVQRALTHN